MDKVTITAAKGLVLLLLLATGHAISCPPCSCEPLEELWGWAVNCSSMGLKEVPPLFPNIRILQMQNNSLTTVLPGALDGLTNVKEMDFSNNPWHCDCSILYLKRWMEDISQASLDKVICATPAALKTRSLSQIHGSELDGCRKPLRIKCLDFMLRDLFLICAAIITLIFALCILLCSGLSCLSV
uniref:Glycoprotein IX platelet n=1 Tax=Varanus komodoensis TaxID=61221 RepID=A0A8D2KVB6_VARKO